MRPSHPVGFAVIAAALVFVGPAAAGPAVDPAGDFLPSYIGPRGGDLDVLQTEVFLHDGRLVFTATVNGLVGSTPGGFYVWGVDRGQGTAGFPTLAPGVLFDAVAVIRPGGASAFNDLRPGGPGPVPITDVFFTGNFISGSVPLSSVRSLGLAPEDFTINLWPRSGGGNALISDFAPDNSNVQVTTTPEPSSLVLFGLAGLSVWAWRARRTRPPPAGPSAGSR